MAMSNESLLLGKKLAEDDNAEGYMIPEGYVAILCSGFGIEGVYTDKARLHLRIQLLRKYNAYKGEALSIDLQELDPSL